MVDDLFSLTKVDEPSVDLNKHQMGFVPALHARTYFGADPLGISPSASHASVMY